MGSPQAEITFCPRCKRPVQARDFMNTWVLGLAESVLQSINCRCGYSGLPITLPRDDYMKLRKNQT